MIRNALSVTVAGAILLLSFLALQSSAQSVTAGLRGKVKELGGKALEGVQVEASKIEQKPVNEHSSSRASSQATSGRSVTVKTYETQTNNKGEFAFTDLVPGNYSLTFQKSGFVTITTWQMEVKAGENVQIGRTVEMPREKQTSSSLIRGAVLGEGGRSFENATVKLERIAGGKLKKETYSTEGGLFAFSVPSEKGIYRVTASARGYEDAVKEIEVEAAEARDIVLTLEKKP